MNATPRNSSSSYETERQIWEGSGNGVFSICQHRVGSRISLSFFFPLSFPSQPRFSVYYVSGPKKNINRRKYVLPHFKLHSTVVWRYLSLKWSTNIKDNAAISLLMSPFTPSWTSPPTSLFLPDSKVMRAVIDQLFQQEMRGHLSEACLNSQLHGYGVVPGQPFHVTIRPALPTQPTWVIVPYPVLITEVLSACNCMHVQRNIGVIAIH